VSTSPALFSKFMADRINNLNDEMLKRPFAFLIKIKNPLVTSSSILGILSERNVKVNTMHLHISGPEEGILIIHCLMEMDRGRAMRGFLEKIKGVTELELLQSRNSNLIKDTDL
jgi:hypothetical protein